MRGRAKARRCSAAFFEVYLERVRDFLNPKTQSPHLKEGPGGVEGLTYKEINTAAEAMQILRLGLRLRVAANTSLNEHSSRSHAIFSLMLRQQQPSGIRQCKLTLVDLAGSEKVRKSGSVGGMLEEAKKINSSLSALGHVIEALSDRRQHIPYRDSRLTRLLEESLGGNCRTTLLVACSSSEIHASETLSSLRFAVRARKIENSVGLPVNGNSVFSSQPSGRQLERRIAQLRRELARLESRRAATRSPSADRRQCSRPSRRRSPEATPVVNFSKVPIRTERSQLVQDVPEALPLGSATLIGSCRSTADPGSGVSSTCSVAAASLTGSAAGTPLSRDREPHREESPCPPVVRGSYSFLIEATPLADISSRSWNMYQIPSKLSSPISCGDAVVVEACKPTADRPYSKDLCGEECASKLSQTGQQSDGPEGPVSELFERCRDLEKQLDAERRRHATELESLHRERSEARLQISPMRSTASGASRLAALTRASTGGGTAASSRSSSLQTRLETDDCTRPSISSQAWQPTSAHAVVLPHETCLAPVSSRPCSVRGCAPKASPVLSQYLCSSPDANVVNTRSSSWGQAPWAESRGGSRLLVASAAGSRFQTPGKSCSPQPALSCSPMRHGSQTCFGDFPTVGAAEAIWAYR